MKYLPISPELFAKNRVKLSQQMAPNSVAIFNSNDIFSTGADSTVPFEQHRNIFYLSGVDQEESILLVFPDAKKTHIVKYYLLKRPTITLLYGKGLNLASHKQPPHPESRRCIG